MGRSDGYNARGCMWDRLIPELVFMDFSERKKAKRAYAEERNSKPTDFNPMPEDELKAMNNYEYSVACNGVNLAPLTPVSLQEKAWSQVQASLDEILDGLTKVPTQTNTPMKGKKMYRDDDDYETPIQTRTDEQKKRDHLEDRLWQINSKQKSATRAQFFMDADQPGTLKELVEKIQAGKFTLDKKNEGCYVGSTYQIDWHDPAHPADKDGYEAARTAFKLLRTQTLDTIKIADPADGLKALQALEAWTPTA